MIKSNITVSLDAMLPGNEEQLKRQIAKQADISGKRLKSFKILRKSVDARKKSNVHFVLTCDLEIDGEDKNNAANKYSLETVFQEVDIDALNANRPVVVGAGPAGLFCALALARAGLRPVLIERGASVEERREEVEAFASGGELNPNTNIQFGEGGAGAFSDGKLTTGKNDPRIRAILEEFAACGAPEDILVDAKPHIGTDYLPTVVSNLRKEIIKAGGEVLFNTQFVGLRQRAEISGGGVRDHTPVPPQNAPLAPFAPLPAFRSPSTTNSLFANSKFVLRGFPHTPAGYLCSLPQSHSCQIAVFLDIETGESFSLETDALVLAIGHSARDTIEMLHDIGVTMERKPFAMGVRIEHPQKLIDHAQYGEAAGHPALPPADYKLNVRTSDGRGVYTFCMCPGGEVVAAASEAGGVCVNGMSNHARDGENANSALLVEIHPEDFDGEDVLAGVEFQRDLERAAFELGKGTDKYADYTAPAQTVEDFQKHAKGSASKKVHPTYPRGVNWCDLHDCLPPVIADSIEEALPKLDRKLRGFAHPQAVLTAVEARSSSPVRIVRDRETLESVSAPGIYPTGEGAGYAGGIMSAAVDGLRVAEAIINKAAVRQAAEKLREGAPVAFPTDTVCGLGVAVKYAENTEALAKLKGRSFDKPIAWLVAGPEALDEFGEDVPSYARELAQKHWPGALTLVVKASDSVPPAFRSRGGTIGLRMPDSQTVLALIRNTQSPIATTSANLAGSPAPAAVSDIDPQIRNSVHTLGTFLSQTPDADECPPSTVVDCTGSAPRVLRQGAVELAK